MSSELNIGGENSLPIAAPSLDILANVSADLDLMRAIGALELDEADTLRFLGSAERFNGQVHVHQDDGNVRVDNNFFLKRTVKHMTGFLAGTREVGLSQSEAADLVLHILDSNPYDHASEQNENAIWAYGEAFKQMATENKIITPDEHKAIRNLIKISGEAGVMGAAAYAYMYATRLGLSPKQATRIIKKLPEADHAISGYTFGAFNGALKSLIPAKVNAASVTEVFEAMASEQPYYSQGSYKLFEQLVIFSCPSARRTPQQLLGDIQQRLTQGATAENALEAIANTAEKATKRLSTGEPSAEVIDTLEDTENYFIDKGGELEILGLPYRTKRSLQDGLNDLGKIARAGIHSNIEVGEGMWVFDDEAQTWYSLGGMLEVTSGHVRNNFIPYDISLLSKNPWTFHVHPDAYSVMIAPPRGEAPFPDEFRDDVTNFLTATPSRADYDVASYLEAKSTTPHTPKAFIVHKYGITEYSYPQDVSRLTEISKASRDTRDDILLAYDWDDATRSGLSRREIIASLVVKLARTLPLGFKLQLLSEQDFID